MLSNFFSSLRSSGTSFIRDEEGATVVEYGMIAAFIGGFIFLLVVPICLMFAVMIKFLVS